VAQPGHVGSNPTPGAIEKTHGVADVFSFLWYCRKGGDRDSTIDGFGRVLRRLARHADINDPHDVADFIARKGVSEARKEVMMNCYADYCRWKSLPFEKPNYRRVKTLPFIPLDAEIEALIAGVPNKISVFCQSAKKTGARPGEAWNPKWVDFDLESNSVTISSPEKNSNQRIMKSEALSSQDSWA